ncbi:MAG: guanylate kinase [Clostridiales bacterium]|nr:guanylate kinase [Clostridiales bacterium]
MMEKGVLIILSGFSGAGKDTVIKKLMSKYDNYALSISATTRAPRVGETEGVSYFYKTVEEFEQMIKEDKLYEYAQFVGNYYGTPKDYVNEQLELGKDVILEIELQGARIVKEKNPEVVTIFVTPPDAKSLKERLIGRGTEDMATINARLRRATEEAQYMDEYDYLLINDDLDICVEELHTLIKSQHFSVNRNIKKINHIREGVKAFSEGE